MTRVPNDSVFVHPLTKQSKSKIPKSKSKLGFIEREKKLGFRDMSCSSVSNRSNRQGSPPGVPRRCWCGEEITTFTAKTKDNPYRRFYRCSIAMKRENEDHLFKWVDEALLDEIRMLDEKFRLVAEDCRDLRKEVVGNMELQKKFVEKMEQEMMKKMNEKIEYEVGHGTSLKTVGVVIVLVVSLVWLWGRV